jgi:hypothetical protein
MELEDPQGDFFRSPIWDDVAVGSCLVKIVAKDR